MINWVNKENKPTDFSSGDYINQTPLKVSIYAGHQILDKQVSDTGP